MKSLREWIAAAIAPDLYRDAQIQRAKKSVAKRLRPPKDPLNGRGVIIGAEEAETQYQREAIPWI